ncbi:MAG: esterase-like activity of phytase family protein [Anderseniella sp.]|nr:esterase-like activity of phytase family protein [Anderseniella sp.]
MPRVLLRLAALLLCSSLLPEPIHADDSLDVTTSSRNFTRFGSATLPSGLSFLGGLTLEADNGDFGGFSGLDVSPDGKSFLSVSDRGHWLAGDFVYRDGRLAGVTNTRLAPLRNGQGNVDERKSRSDAEAVAAWTSKGIKGKVIVGFERRERVELFNLGGKRGLAAAAERVRLPKAASEGKSNGELEALGRFLDGPLKGWLIGISERNETPDGALRGWLWKTGKTHEFHITRRGDYRITGLAILPGSNEIITIERSFNPPFGVGMAMRRFKVADLQNRAAGSGTLVFDGKLPAYTFDNMEGIAAHRDERGTVITVISDDNFNRSIQSTVMFQFRLGEN